MPIQKVTLRSLAIPIPFDGFPKPRNPTVESLLCFIGTAKILACGEKSLHQKRCFHQVAAIIEHAKNRHGLSGASIHIVGPCAMVALRAFEEAHDFSEAFHALLTSNEPAIHADDEST